MVKPKMPEGAIFISMFEKRQEIFVGADIFGYNL